MFTETAIEARRAYKREWAKQNRDKVKAQQERYWQRKAAEREKQQAEKEKPQAENPTNDI